jgi:hypothetical protein
MGKLVTGTLMIANWFAAGAPTVSFCTCAAAADLTGRPPPPLMPIYSWSGFHGGGHASGETVCLRSDNLRSRLGVAADT